MFVDTHAHLSFPELAVDLPAVIDRARCARVTRIISIAAEPAAVEPTQEIGRRFPEVSLAVGLHPELAGTLSLDAVADVRRHAIAAEVVAIGEIGLDYYRAARLDGALRQKQQDLFRAQLALAKDLGKPVIIHNREANADLLGILRAHAPGFRPWGVVHCFGGDERFGLELLELGLRLSYTGILTFKNAAVLRTTAARIPLDQVMLETDAPYLAPQPHRGTRNEPAYVPLIAQALAELHGVPVVEVAAATTRCAEQLFRWR